MHRAQVLIEEWHYEFLRSLAERQGRSVSEILREMLNRELQHKSASRKGGIEEIEGLFDDTRVSAKDHDRLLYRKRRR